MPQWVTESFPIIRIVMIVLMLLLCVAIVVCIFLQPSNSEGAGVITGQASETYYSKNKKTSLQSLFKKLTTAFCITCAVIAVLFFISLSIYNPLTV